MPSAAKGFYERDSRDELLAAQLGGSKFDVQRGALRRGDFKVGDEAVTVLIVNNLELLAGGDEGVIFRGVLIGEEGLGGKVVFDFREGGQNALAIAGDHFVVSRAR